MLLTRGSSVKLTFGRDDFIIPTVSGRYGKYGELKRLARLRASRRDIAVRRGRACRLGANTGRERSLRRRAAHPFSKEENRGG